MAKTPLVALEEQKIALEEKDDKGVRRRVTRSKLRKSLAKLQPLEDKSWENIGKDLNGEKIEKRMVDTAKWIISQLQSLTKAATADEAEINGLRFKALELEQKEGEEAAQEQEADAQETKEKPRFSLVQLPTNEDL